MLCTVRLVRCVGVRLELCQISLKLCRFVKFCGYLANFFLIWRRVLLWNSSLAFLLSFAYFVPCITVLRGSGQLSLRLCSCLLTYLQPFRLPRSFGPRMLGLKALVKYTKNRFNINKNINTGRKYEKNSVNTVG